MKFGQGVYWGDGGSRAQIMGVSGGRLTPGGGEVAGRACPAPTGGERKIVGRPALRPPRACIGVG